MRVQPVRPVFTGAGGAVDFDSLRGVLLMSELRKAAQQALEALEHGWIEKGDEVVASLRVALAHPEPEPCRYPDCVDNGPEGKCMRWLLAECSKSEDFKPQRQPLRYVTYVCPVCAASLERQE